MTRPYHRAVVWLLLATLLAACSTTKRGTSSGSSQGSATTYRGGGYYQDDGPADNTPRDLDRIADAVPRVEPYASGSNKPYSVFGHEYVPDTSERPFSEQGIGSWYGRKFNGQKTSSGEIYDMFAMTAAHPTLPIPSYARVTNPANGRSVIVRINDRGPFHPGRIIDLSYAAAYRLGYVASGSAPVQVDRILPADIRAGRIPNANPVEPPVQYANSAPAPQAAVAVALPPPAPATSSLPPTKAAANNLYDQLPADLLPTEVALSAAPGTSVAVSESAGLVSSASGDAVFLQLAAFRARSGADDFLAHMNGELDSGLSQRLRVVAATDIYRVQLGPYANRSEALNAAQRLRADLGLEPMVVSPR